uniref:Calcium/calmodulin-dependent protein kinase II association-domain domain-containing protein n=1 Tax=Heterosigma akashiwo TaxID=2829 RepID=A0A7S3Y617_HETAK
MLVFKRLLLVALVAAPKAAVVRAFVSSPKAGVGALSRSTYSGSKSALFAQNEDLATAARVKAAIHGHFMPKRFSTSSVSAKGMPKMPGRVSESEARNLFYLWNDALATLDADTVAKRYARKGVLLPTVSDTPRADYDSIKDYFVNFLQLQPQGVILESYATTGDNWCKDVGIYEFTMGATGDKVKARYSFVYVYEDGEWKIAHHHSSKMPEAPAGMQISDDEVRSLFYLWNDALATLDPDQVANRYAKEGVLLPTVSDTPRADYSSIKAYFTDFLKKKPQGEIMESYVTSGINWCKDVGTYEFTMGATGDKVKGRYSFVYVYEDQEWKIAHHHSSVMPEGMLAAAAKLEELEKERVVLKK